MVEEREELIILPKEDLRHCAAGLFSLSELALLVILVGTNF